MEYQRVLDFWFKENNGKWFLKSEEFDNQIREEFLPLYEDIRDGKKSDWEKNPHSMLALIIVLDQFSRNMFRGHPRAFELDSMALLLTKKAILEGFDKKLSIPEKVFYICHLNIAKSLKIKMTL